MIDDKKNNDKLSSSKKRPAAAREAVSSDGERLAKRIARAGFASRRGADALIEAGKVRVNGELVMTPAFTVTDDDKVEVDGKQAAKPPIRLWLYHKPAGLVTSARDEKGRKTVFDDLPKAMGRVVSVGRLDLNSEGLLILTNDGDLKRRLELPDTGWRRNYRVRAHGRVSLDSLEKLKNGITVDGEHFRPMEVVFDREQGANNWLNVGLREGKNREVRRAFEAIGLQVNRLIRVSYGPFQLGTLERSGVQEVRAGILRQQLGKLVPQGAEFAEQILDLTPPEKKAEIKVDKDEPTKTRGKARRFKAGQKFLKKL